MTPKAASPLKTGLALGTLILAASGALAQTAAPVSDANFAGTLSALAASASAQASAQRLEAEYPDGYGWSPAVSVTAFPEMLAARVTPDYSFTPGRLCSPTDPNFKEYRYAEHIPYCRRTVTVDMKTAISAHYGILRSGWSNYEFDHLIPLSIGGDSSNDNLWPQPHRPGTPDGSEGKDKLELQLYLQMRDGKITQAEAVRQIYAWFAVSDMARKVIQLANR